MPKNQTIHSSQNTNLSIVLFVLFGVCVLVFGILPATADAALLPRCNPVPSSPDVGPNLPTCGVEHLLELLVYIYNYLLGFAALVAMLFIVFGGVRMLYFSYMEDSAAELEAAKYTVRRAIGGFIIIATAYLLVATLLFMLGVNRGGEAGTVGKILESIGL